MTKNYNEYGMRLDVNNNAIILTAESYEKYLLGDEQMYDIVTKWQQRFPGFELKRAPKQNKGKKTYAGLTESVIRLFLSVQEEGETLIKEYEKEIALDAVLKTSNGKTNKQAGRSWFLRKYHGYDVLTIKAVLREKCEDNEDLKKAMVVAGLAEEVDAA